MRLKRIGTQFVGIVLTGVLATSLFPVAAWGGSAGAGGLGCFSVRRKEYPGDSSILPTPAERNKEEYVYNEAGTNAIKQEVKARRAVTLAFCADSYKPGQIDPPQYINTENDEWAHYTYDKDAAPNHAMTIIGWDDGYSKNNFLTNHQPPQDGAWIVKNSWGAIDQESPNKFRWGKGGNGYFCISYYDKSLQLPESFKFDTSKENDYFINQYDVGDMPRTQANHWIKQKAPEHVQSRAIALRTGQG